MHAFIAYLPADRWYALAGGSSLPEQTQGSALFADISGFTPLTEGFARELGARRGAEELTRLLNQVYDALIAEVDRYGGSVVSFSGDAITCWFHEQAEPVAPAPARATACGLALQAAMRQFATVALPDGSVTALLLKIAVASGPARRFAVGDPAFQLLDVIAGATVVRLALGEHLAHNGEIVLDAATAAAIGAQPALEWRADQETGERFAVLTAPHFALQHVAASSHDHAPDLAHIRPWILPAVRDRLEEGLGEFLTELRPAVALFLRFGGIDYDSDSSAGEQLDAFIRRVQIIIQRYDGALLQLTVGDKGSYLYAAFGAPIAHEDDARRAVLAALELRALPDELPFLTPLQIGMSGGTMRTGAYGGSSRRTYGALGNEVNLAARLMQHATPGDVLASAHIYETAAGAFVWDVLPAIRVKGQSAPVPIARLISSQSRQAAPTAFAGGMIGRANELHSLIELLAPLAHGRFAGMLYVYGEAGMGKSRLLYELRQQLSVLPAMRPPLWFMCPADQLLHQSLSPFRRFLRSYAGQDLSSSSEANRARFDTTLDALIAAMRDAVQPELAAELDRTRSFLGALIELRWDGSLYEQLEPKLRFENTLAALKTVLLAESQLGPVVVQIEDAHWLDEDSRALLALLTRNASAFPFAVLLSGRYNDDGSAITINVDADVPQHALHLQALESTAIWSIAAQTLGGDVDDQLAQVLLNKTDGNPFFTEQLALDLRERGLLTRGHDQRWQIAAGALSEVPPNINLVLIARLDRLAAQVKAVVQMAAVLGQEFEVRVLGEMLREDHLLPTRVRQAEADAIWRALDEIRYLFRHALLRDAAYSMQLWSRLRELHLLAAEALTQVYAGELTAHAADLTYHYGKAGDTIHERSYARIAGEHAAAQFANADAAAYFSRALELTPIDDQLERYTLLLARERIYDLQGDRDAQREDIAALQALAEQLNTADRRIEVALRQARAADVTSDYVAMIAAAQSVIAIAQASGATDGAAAGALQWARALWYQGSYDQSRAQAQHAFELARAVGAPKLEADSLRVLGNIALYQSEYAAAHSYYDQAARIQLALGDRQGESATRNNLGIIAWYQGDYAGARAAYAYDLQIKHEVGDRYGQSLALLNLGEVAAVQGDYAGALAYYAQALRLKEETADRYGQSVVLANLGDVAMAGGDTSAARSYFVQSLDLCRSLGHRQQESWVLARMALLFRQLEDYASALTHADDALLLAQAINDRNTQGHALTQRGHAHAALSQFLPATSDYQQALELRRALSQANGVIEALAGLAQVALMQGDHTAAANYAAEVRVQRAAGTPEGLEESALIDLICYRVLLASGDGAATQLLESAYTELQARAERIGDAHAQRLFLEQIPAHRELMHAWAVHSAHRR